MTLWPVRTITEVEERPLCHGEENYMALGSGDVQTWDPADVPLHAFEFRRATLTVEPVEVDLDSGIEAGTETDTVKLFAVKAPATAIGRDADGNLFVIRKGDWVLRSESGDYGILRPPAEEGA